MLGWGVTWKRVLGSYMQLACTKFLQMTDNVIKNTTSPGGRGFLLAMPWRTIWNDKEMAEDVCLGRRDSLGRMVGRREIYQFFSPAEAKWMEIKRSLTCLPPTSS